jgi:hypothetical protein
MSDHSERPSKGSISGGFLRDLTSVRAEWHMLAQASVEHRGSDTMATKPAVPSALFERIQRDAGLNGILEALTDRLQPNELQSLMLEVYARLAGKVTPARLLEQYVRDRFVRPSAADPRVSLEFDSLAMSVLPPAFQPLELGPLCPLGTSSVVGTVSQNKVVSTSRNTEVLSDATNVLALEAAVRRKEQKRAGAPLTSICLAASQRMTRAQGLPGPRSWAHFRLFGMISAGRDQGTWVFEGEQLRVQLETQLRLLAALKVHGFEVHSPRVALTDLSEGRILKHLEARVVAPLAKAFPDVAIEWDPSRSSGRGYYESACFKLHVRNGQGEELEIGDGGDVGWMRALCSDAKERLVISGLGSERLIGLRGRAI